MVEWVGGWLKTHKKMYIVLVGDGFGSYKMRSY